MSLYIVSMSITQGPYGPSVSMTYHGSETEARESYRDCLNDVGDDPATIRLSRFNESTMTDTILEAFEGNMDDLEPEEEEEG